MSSSFIQGIQICFFQSAKVKKKKKTTYTNLLQYNLSMTQKITVRRWFTMFVLEGKYKATTQENLYGFINVVHDLLLLHCG